MKESMSAQEKMAEPSEEQSPLEAKPAENGSPAKKATVRKPVRPRIARPAATTTTKKDPFEVEFAFDPNEDPFKPKKKLDLSPTRDGDSPTTSVPQSDINTTIDAVFDPFILFVFNEFLF